MSANLTKDNKLFIIHFVILVQEYPYRYEFYMINRSRSVNISTLGTCVHDCVKTFIYLYLRKGSGALMSRNIRAEAGVTVQFFYGDTNIGTNRVILSGSFYGCELKTMCLSLTLIYV
jgi:hypothetical protein